MRCDHLLAVSVDPAADPAELNALAQGNPQHLLPGLVRDVDDTTAVPITTPMAGGTVWTVGWTPQPIRPSGGRAALFGLSADPLAGYRPVDPDDLLRRLAAAAPSLADIAAPFAAACVDERGQLTAMADAAGLRHLYAVQTHSWAAVCTSARVLAQLAGVPLDPEALGVFRLVGFHLGGSTTFHGVAKLPAGCLWRLADGRLTTVEYGRFDPADEPDSERFDPASTASHYGRRLRSVVEACLDHDPQAVLELSGGFDSRLLLAAVPPGRRAGLRAMTVAASGSDDAPVASGIARQCGLRHKVVDLAGLGRLEPEQAYALVRRAAARHDCMGDPLAHGVLDWVEQRFPPSLRLTGLAGEMARGAYLFAPTGAGVEPSEVDRFARWWIIGNDAVPDGLLAAGYAELSRAITRERLRKVFAEYGTDLVTATDRFYLRERVHRWGGLTATGGCLARTIVVPALDEHLVASALRVPQPLRRGSHFAARVMAGLDRELAGLPMASGVRPVSLGRSFSIPGRLGERTIRGVAAGSAGKVWRRVRSSNRPAHGAALLGAAVREHWRDNPHLLEPALRTGLIRPEAVDRLLDRSAAARGGSPAAVGLLVNLSVAASGLPAQRRWIDADL